MTAGLHRLLVEAWSDAIREVTVSGWTKDNKAIDEFTLTTTADRAKCTVNRDIPGWPEFIEVGTQTAGVQRGRLFVRVSYYISGTKIKLLCAGYVTDIPITMDIIEEMVSGNGYIKNITGTNPAAGADINETVPTNVRWRLVCVRAVLVASAVAGNRYVSWQITDDGGVILWARTYNLAHTVSVTDVYQACDQGSEGIAPGTGANCTLPLPNNLRIPQGWHIKTGTSGILAGDDWAAPQMLVEEWIEE